MQGVPRPVDDGLQQLIPCSGRGREARDVVDEAELVELVGARGRTGRRLGFGALISTSHVHHHTRVGTGPVGKGCGRVAAWLRYVPATCPWLGP
jgi:hypothetical protein